MKPSQDPISDKKSPDYDEDTRSRRFDSDTTSPRTPRTDEPLDPVNERDRSDLFRSPRTGTEGDTDSSSRSGVDSPMFNDGVDPATERTNQKPPMIEPQDEKTLDPVESDPGKPTDEKTFFEDTSKPDNSASRGRNSVLARTSSLSEVIAPKRLASRSLPASHRSVSSSKLADKSDNTTSDAPRALRWISAPLPEGHVSL